MAFVEDRQLLQLSASPKERLFPVLNRAEGLAPLIVLLALLPPLFVLMNRTLTPLDALWGLKAVTLSTADEAEVWLDPATARPDEADVPLKWQPPLSSWIIAGLMAWMGPDRPLALVLSSFLATIALIALTFGFANRLRGPQFGWWTVCLMAMHGPLLLGAQTPAPQSLIAALAVAACWGFTVHCQDSKRTWSLPLAGAGIAWGLCLLAGGVVALVLLAILLAFVLAQHQEAKRLRKDNGSPFRRTWNGPRALKSLGVLFLIGFVVGGWWEVWMFARHGAEFLSGWFVRTSPLVDASRSDSGMGRLLARDVSQMFGALSGLSLLGAIFAVRRMVRLPRDSRDVPLFLIVSWAGCAGFVWLCLRAGPHQADAYSGIWRGFCLVPCVLLAALAVEQIGQRQIGVLPLLAGVLLTVWLLLVFPPLIGFGLGSTPRPLWPSLEPVLRAFFSPETFWLVMVWTAAFLLSSTVLAAWSLWQFVKDSDFRQRAFLRLSVGLLLVLHAVIGFFGLRQTTLDDQALAALRGEMIQQPVCDRWTIVSASPAPITLRFVLASLWPNAQAFEVESWWDKPLTRNVSEDHPHADSQVVIDWSDREIRTPTLRVADPTGRQHLIEFTPVGSPQILWKHRLRVYRPNDRLLPDRPPR